MSTRKKTTRKQKKHKRSALLESLLPTTRSVPRSVHVRLPASYDITIVYTVKFTVATAAQFLTKLFNSNSAADPGITGSPGYVPLYSEFSAMYAYSRVLGFEYRIDCSNRNTFPVDVFEINSSGTPGTGQQIIIAGNPYGRKSRLSGATGGKDSIALHSGYITICDIVGERAPLTDDTFRAAVNANPTDLTWLGVGFESVGGSNITSGIDCSISLALVVRFSDRILQV